MAYAKFISSEPTTISVPYWFIKDYMPAALGGYVKVYLYLVATYTMQEGLDLSETATALDMLYSEVISALKYWDGLSIISFTTLSDDEFEIIVNFDKPTEESSPTQVLEASIQTNTLPIAKTYIQQTRPNYSAQELNIYRSEDRSITQLFLIAEQYLGRLLSSTDQQVLFGLYDWLHMPLDLIEYLIEYCVSNNHTAIRYIEKVAISWVDMGILTVDAAKLRATNDKKYHTILNELGLSSQQITSIQKEYIDKWLDTYKLKLDIVLEGCKRAVAQTKNPSLKYLDAMLSSWYNTKVANLDDIDKLDKAYSSNIAKKASAPTKSVAKKNTRFTNIASHNWDFDQLERLEQEYIERKLHGGN
ncbi:MAG: DnaD domain protein [Cellulosilyticaceae bacterium]